MSAHHHHHHHRTGDARRMRIVLGINLLLLAAGVVGGVVFDSLALLADAGHVLADVGAIGLALFAAWLAARPPSPQRTFGFRRTEILAALANGLLLVVVSVLVFVEAVARLSNPPQVHGAGVLIVGALGLAGNAVAAWVLMKGDRSNLNLEGVLRHSAADALGSLGVIVAGLVVITTGWDQADPLVSIAIGVLILLGSWRLLREPFNVLMESAPEGIDVQELGQAMCGVPGVREVHDLHVWTVTSGFPALAAHIRSDPNESPEEVRERLEAVLHERFGLDHTTLQVVPEPLLQLEDRRRR
ncbi:MAG TPA: cation diffusion facilitator family transporter [Thermoleophilaceae bacterium]|jgi:cobalt-zinc-cadmium efflux system protein|nr:cation diffusion facilitator family transporter [Thermoleophilaceae bacterium]